jgi:hypothetical protein
MRDTPPDLLASREMRFLDRFRRKRRSVIDSAFGELAYEEPWWRGKVRFRPCASEVAVNIESDEGGPSEQQRIRFRELDQKYHDLLPLIGVALWELYRPVRTELERDRHARLGPSDARGMVEKTALFGIDLRRDGGIELGYGFVPDVGWDDAMFTVALDGWTPRPLSLDD